MKASLSLAVLGCLASLPLAVLGSPFGPVPKPVVKRTQQLALNTNFPDPSIEQVRAIPSHLDVQTATDRHIYSN